MKIRPIEWLFSHPTGSVGRRVSGYYWRVVAAILLGIVVMFQYLPPGMIAQVVVREASSEELNWLASVMTVLATVISWFLAFLTLSLMIEVPRLLHWLILSDDFKKVVESAKEETEKDRVEEQKKRAELAKSLNIVTLNALDSARVVQLRSKANVLSTVLFVVFVLALPVFLLFFTPSLIRENLSVPWIMFAAIIEVLPFHMFLLGLILFLLSLTATGTYVHRREQKMASNYPGWKEGVSNRVELGGFRSIEA